MKIPKISIVIPSFNKARFIGQTLDSIVGQKYPNLELIIQDGGSIDGTLEIIREYAREYLGIIKYESKKDKGQLFAINKGMKKATGEILTFINADDVYESGAFNSIAKAYTEFPNSLWFAGKGKVIGSSGREIAKFATWYKNFLLALNSNFFLLITNYFMQPSVFITRKAWEKYGPFTGTPSFVTEYDLWLKIAKHEMPVVLGKHLSSFRIERSTITKTSIKKLLSEDELIIRRYTTNLFIVILHKLHNYVRRVIGKIV